MSTDTETHAVYQPVRVVGRAPRRDPRPRLRGQQVWFVDPLGWRVVQEWMYGDLQLAYIAPPATTSFHVEILAGPGRRPQPRSIPSTPA